MKSEIIYTADMFQEMNETGYFYQFVEGRTLSPVLHRHDFYEICMMLKGRSVQEVNGRRLEMEKGEIVFLSPEETHCYTSQSEGMVLLGLSVHAHRFRTVVEAFGFEPVYGKKYSFASERFSRERMFALAGNPKQKCLMLNSLLCEMFLNLPLDEFEERKLVPTFLQEGYSQLAKPENVRGGMTFLMEQTRYSRSQLCRLTMQYYQKTPTEMITEYRMNLAKEYLQNTNDTLEVIAEKIGYKSVSQLHKVFRERFGESPGGYRKRRRYM